MSDRTMSPTLDERDVEIVARRMADYARRPGARVGDFIDFADGVSRRISHVWGAAEWGQPADKLQTSDSGTYYLGGAGGRVGLVGWTDEAYISFSGALYTTVSADTLTDTGTHREGAVWIFHHEEHRAHNGVDVRVPFRVFRSSAPAPR